MQKRNRKVYDIEVIEVDHKETNIANLSKNSKFDIKRNA